MNYDEQYRILK